jgi:DNA-binding NarL/FixJ family response regulator
VAGYVTTESERATPLTAFVVLSSKGTVLSASEDAERFLSALPDLSDIVPMLFLPGAKSKLVSALGKFFALRAIRLMPRQSATSSLETEPACLITLEERPQVIVGDVVLTPRQSEIFHLLVTGYADKEIAGLTNTAVGTVHSHIKRIYSQLGVRSRRELVKFVDQSAESGVRLNIEMFKNRIAAEYS